MFIRSMDYDYQVLSILYQNEYRAGYLCRRYHCEKDTTETCYLYAFRPEGMNEEETKILMELAACNRPADLKASFLAGEDLYLEFPCETGNGIKEAIAGIDADVKPLSLKEKLTGVTPADQTLPERIAMAENLMAACLALRLPGGMLVEVLSSDNLICRDGQFDFSYHFTDAENLLSDRKAEVFGRLAELIRLIFGKNLDCPAAETLKDWVLQLENPGTDMQTLADIYPAFYDALQLLKDSEPEGLIVESEFRKEIFRLIGVVKHILSPVPTGENDYVIIGNFHVFNKLLILAGAAAAAIILKYTGAI